ncbi:kinesin-like protein KIN-5D [Impatiens glandulifera]|uniref:kinesin-like protein KIN-5D n=1 Tax=Impatiens glandulifera TaxID=253017 RepID=UPI001FB12129|nr:kinesin-like protein KIN-5D [Impatiens glandulifera]
MVCNKLKNDAQSSLASLEKRNITFMDTIIKDSGEAIEACQRFSSAALSTTEEAGLSSNDFISSIEYIRGIDADATERNNSVIAVCRVGNKRLEDDHCRKVDDILGSAAEKCNIRNGNEVYSWENKIESIKELRTSAFRELLLEFEEAGKN